MDGLDEILFDDDVVWTGPVSRGASDSTAITWPDRGTITIYWGTATQPLDASLAASGVTHPAYRRQCYVVVDLFLGANKTSMPNMEFVLRRAPVVPWLTASPLIGDDANPVAARDVAKSLGITLASVYLAKHRVSTAVRKELVRIERELEQEASRRI